MSSWLLDPNLLNDPWPNTNDHSFDLSMDAYPTMSNTKENSSAKNRNVQHDNGSSDKGRVSSTLPTFGPDQDIGLSHSDADWSSHGIGPENHGTSVADAVNAWEMPFHHPLPWTETLMSNAVDNAMGSRMTENHSTSGNTGPPIVMPPARDE